MDIKKYLLTGILAAFIALPSVASAWSSDINVNTPIAVAADDQSSAVMVEDGAGGAIIAWTDYRNSDTRDIYAQRVDATGAVQWTLNGVPVCTAAEHQNSIHIISDGNGGTILAWNDRRDGSSQIYAQRLDVDGNALWTSGGIHLAEMNSSSAIISDDAGGAIVAWTNIDKEVYARRINATGSIEWTSVKLNPELAGAPFITSDGGGGAIITWAQGSGDVFAQRVDASGEILWAAGGLPVAADPDVNENVRAIAADESGGAVVFLFINGLGYCAQKLNASGATQWPTVVWVTNDGSINHAFIKDGLGGALISWWKYREDNEPYDPNDLAIYVQGVDTDGNLRWPPDGLLIGYRPYATGHDIVPIISDNAGGFIASWTITDSNYNGDIYAQHFNTEGLPQWGTNPAAVCTNPAVQREPAVAGDGAGGAIFVWRDYRNGEDDEDLYAHKISADGGSSGLQTPSNLSPSDGAHIDAAPTLGASAFVDASGLLSHAASQWRINNANAVTPETPEHDISGDEGYFSYHLPFSFPFFERNITSISVNTNGLIELLEDGETDYANDRYGTHSDGEHIDNMDAIFAANDDLDLINGHLRLYNAGTHVAIEWYGDTYLDADADPNYPDVTNSMLFQVVLNQDGKITWNFSQLDFNQFDYDLYSGVYPNGGTEISMISGSLSDVTTPSAFEFNPVTRAITPSTYNWFTPQPVLYDSGESTDLLSHLVPGTVVLEDAVTYYWGVRYKGDNNEWSLWSTPTSFTADLLPPTVTAKEPSAATDVAINTVISATFNKTMDADSFTVSSFTLTGSDGDVAGTVTYDAMTASLMPDSDLAYNTDYTATITTDVTDTLGKPIASAEIWSFKTGLAADETAPKVESYLPTNDPVAIDIGSISAIFSEPINPTTLNEASFTLTTSAGAVAGSVSYDAATRTARFDPDALLTYGTEFTVTITTAIKDNAGNSMESDFPWIFTTANAPPPPAAQDSIRPRVVTVTPVVSLVPTAIGSITATFSEPIQGVDTTSFIVTDSGGVVPGTVQYDEAAMTAWFFPAADLAYNTQYTVRIPSSLIRDLSDNTMLADREWFFTTSGDPASAGCDPDAGNENGCDSFDYFTYGTGVDVGTYGSSITGYAAEYAARGSVSFEEALSQDSVDSSSIESQAIARVDNTSFSLQSRSSRMETSQDLAGAWSMGASKIDVKGAPPGTVIPMSIVVSGNFTGQGGTLLLQVSDFDGYRGLGSATVAGSGSRITYTQMVDVYGDTDDAASYVKTTGSGSNGFRLDFLYPAVPNNGIYVWFVAGTFNGDSSANSETDFTARLEITPPPGVTVTLASGQVFTGALDTDGDGVSNLEDISSDNAAVASPASATGTGSITVDVSGNPGATLSQVRALDEDDFSLIQDNKPTGQQFPDGLVSFRVNGVEPGGTATVTLTFPTQFSTASYYKVNETGFYEIDPDFASFSGNTVTLRLVDGGEGDGDGLENGVIEDPGGVAVPDAVSNSNSGIEWYNSCFITVADPRH